MTTALRFVPPRVPFLDKSGFIRREWYLFLQGVFNRIGGTSGQGSDDLMQDMLSGGGSEETKALLFSVTDALNQTPVAVQLEYQDQQYPPQLDQQATLNQLIAEVSAQRDTLAELIKTVQGIQQSTLI